MIHFDEVRMSKYILTICDYDKIYTVARRSSSNPSVYRNIAECPNYEDAKFILAKFQEHE